MAGRSPRSARFTRTGSGSSSIRVCSDGDSEQAVRTSKTQGMSRLGIRPRRMAGEWGRADMARPGAGLMTGLNRVGRLFDRRRG